MTPKGHLLDAMLHVFWIAEPLSVPRLRTRCRISRLTVFRRVLLDLFDVRLHDCILIERGGQGAGGGILGLESFGVDLVQIGYYFVVSDGLVHDDLL